MPSCRELSSPTRPIAQAKLSSISDVCLPESNSANVLTLIPWGVATTTGTICSKTAEGNAFNGRSSDKDRCCGIYKKTGRVADCSQMALRRKRVLCHGLVGGVICHSLPCHIVSCAYSPETGGLPTQNKKSTTSFLCLVALFR